MCKMTKKGFSLLYVREKPWYQASTGGRSLLLFGCFEESLEFLGAHAFLGERAPLDA